ncbi:ribonuclease H [Trifolium pratense]|uniref:Ribonuclease H n=1 Tax=Trifolium pratense TaxID=57577 RepID=A0A2K3P1W6_TRIPR|nr:ribonuclease H [Trifolium pratense]
MIVSCNVNASNSIFGHTLGQGTLAPEKLSALKSNGIENGIQWMMFCVSSVNYSVLVNFERVGSIYPGRGLRQGYPLSPYLFILVVERLSALIKKSVASGDIHGVKICRGAPMVSQLLFVDNCFL